MDSMPGTFSCITNITKKSAWRVRLKLFKTFLINACNYFKVHQVATTGSGIPVRDKTATLTAGYRGPVLIEDAELLEDLSHFNRERIPERVVHAKGFGAKGFFEVTNDITKYSAAKVFSSVGKKTPVAVRFSMSAGDKGGADTDIDPRGFAIKFYTEDGTWDVLGINLPVFASDEPKLFTSLVHAAKRDPVTNLLNTTAFWDIITLAPESTLSALWLFSPATLPCTMRGVNAFAVNTFKLVNENGEYVYCKFNIISNEEAKYLTLKQAEMLKSSDPDYYQRDMFDSIAKGNFPSWTLKIQVMTQLQAELSPINPFDSSKLWPEHEYPMIEVGRIVLNENPSNYFAEVEQIGFSPANLVPGIQPSVDKILHARLFAYMDAQRYRIGNNFQQLPINRPINPVRNYQRDGHMAFVNQGGAPNYYPNSFGGPEPSTWAKNLSAPYYVSGYAYQYHERDPDYFSQPRDFYVNKLDDEGRKFVISAIAQSLSQTMELVQFRVINMFAQVNEDLARGIAEKLLIIPPIPNPSSLCGL
ncbi:catalase-like [Agrilus planipennis]|uniref:Catalase n=1 Tax=Agrilus planipennis TaxID=224129 RepID=A0A1W4W6K6_AGRPL|nr:catalase-like [Agrilus planipennis]